MAHTSRCSDSRDHFAFLVALSWAHLDGGAVANLHRCKYTEQVGPMLVDTNRRPLDRQIQSDGATFSMEIGNRPLMHVAF